MGIFRRGGGGDEKPPDDKDKAKDKKGSEGGDESARPKGVFSERTAPSRPGGESWGVRRPFGAERKEGEEEKKDEGSSRPSTFSSLSSRLGGGSSEGSGSDSPSSRPGTGPFGSRSSGSGGEGDKREEQRPGGSRFGGSSAPSSSSSSGTGPLGGSRPGGPSSSSSGSGGGTGPLGGSRPGGPSSSSSSGSGGGTGPLGGSRPGSPFSRPGSQEEKKEEDTGGSRPGGSAFGSRFGGGSSSSSSGAGSSGGSSGGGSGGTGPFSRSGGSGGGGGSPFSRPGGQQEEKKEDTGGSRPGSPFSRPGSPPPSGSGGGSPFSRPGGQQEEKKEDTGGSRPGGPFSRPGSPPASGSGGGSSFSRPGGQQEEKKEESGGSRPGGPFSRQGSSSSPASSTPAGGSGSSGPFSRSGSGSSSSSSSPPASGSGGSSPFSRPGSSPSSSSSSAPASGSGSSSPFSRPGSTPASSTPSGSTRPSFGASPVRPSTDTDKDKGKDKDKDKKDKGKDTKGKKSEEESSGRVGLFGMFGRRGAVESETASKRKSTPEDDKSKAKDKDAKRESPAVSGRRPDDAVKTAAATTLAASSAVKKDEKKDDKKAPTVATKPREKAAPLPTDLKLPKNVTQGISLDRKLDMLGLGLLAVGLVMFFSWLTTVMPLGTQGEATGGIDNFFAQLFGELRFVIPMCLVGVGGWLLVRHFGKSIDIDYWRILGYVLLYGAALVTVQWWDLMFTDFPSKINYVASIEVLDSQSTTLWEDGRGGGWIGHIFYITMVRILGDMPLVFALLGWWVISAFLAFDLSVEKIATRYQARRRERQVRMAAVQASRAAAEAETQQLTRASIDLTRTGAGNVIASEETISIPTRRLQETKGRTEAPVQPPTATSPVPPPTPIEDKKGERKIIPLEGRSAAPSDAPITAETDGDKSRRTGKTDAKGRSEAPSNQVDATTDGDAPRRRGMGGIFGRRQSSEETATPTPTTAASVSSTVSPSSAPPSPPAESELRGRTLPPSDKPIDKTTNSSQPARVPIITRGGRTEPIADKPVDKETDGESPLRRSPIIASGGRTETPSDKVDASTDDDGGKRRFGMFGGRKSVTETPPASPEKVVEGKSEAKSDEASAKPVLSESKPPISDKPIGIVPPVSTEANKSEKIEEKSAEVSPVQDPNKRRGLFGMGGRTQAPQDATPPTVSPSTPAPLRDAPKSSAPSVAEKPPVAAPSTPATSGREASPDASDANARRNLFGLGRRGTPSEMPESPAPTGRREAPPSVPVARSPIIPERAAPEKSEEKPTSPASGSGFLGRTQPPESPLASPSSTPAPPRETKVEDKAEAVSSPTTLPPRRAPFPVTASPASEANAPVTEAFSLDEAKKPDAATPPPNANARPAFSAMRPSMGRPMGEETGDKLEDKGQTSSAHPSLRPEKVDIDDLANAADDVSTAATYRDRLLSRRQPIKSESISLDGPEASASQDNETPSSPPRSAVFFDRRRESPSPETVTEAKPIGVFAPARPSDADKPSDEAKVAGNGQTEAKPEMPIAPARPRGLVFETPSTAPIGRERPTAPPSLPEKPVLISEKATPEAQEKVPPSVESSTLPEKAEDRLATAAAATLAAVQTAQAVKEETPAKVEKVEAPAIEAHKPKPIEQKRPAPPTTPPTSVFDPPRGSKEARAALAAEPIPEGGRWICPNYMELLQQGSTKEIDDQVLIERARIIEDTLNSFGASGKVVEINSGPVITQFGVEPDYNEKRGGGRSRVKVSAIAALEKDIALALAAKTIRIEAPVPGKGYVGIEVPNSEAALVSLRDVMMSEQHKKLVEKSKLAIGLGKRVDGTPLSADLTQMPHLLIAGTTGSGKSVCVNAIISCLLMQNTPDELQIIMVDPKRVELAGYNGIPHLVAPVVVDLERIVGVLKWVQREMDDRYKRFAATSARNITDFNRKQPEGQPKMPYLVVIVDELADLMMLAPDETERLIARLAQMARATGIHLIISTQRPSVDVVTGLIKANFPARVAFAVASSVDSRVILDQPGAEKLLGRGDMLYQAPDAAAPYRMQGVYLSDAEINTITNYWKGPRALRSGATRPEAKIDLTSAPLSVYTPPAIPTQARSASSPSSIVIRRVQDDSKLGGASKGQDKLDDDGLWDEDEEDFADIEDDEDFDGESDSLYDNAVELVKSRKKASISMLQRHFRIGYVRAARLIDLMEQNGVVGPAETGAKPRRVNTTE